ncbi:SHOCT domain-containing protein [Inhella gelatinilytica]|uniref:SHOCT domain-containing protein n=1 Tax=Inhella gelatinilytica TaxID=2795030 RepID=A0A931IYJ2_9BURK|nr:SHOCT domain-containing protein [Inhella gelatinilytica]MBH9553961.1 SHOCT domain-containing protein [Inhella gelatinilytica]
MWDKLKDLGGKAKTAVASATTLVGDLNGDGKVDEEDARIAAEWAKLTASTVATEAGRLTKEALRSDMAKDAAAGAAVGAVVAVPVPLVGPMAGAAIGAGIGVYKNLTKKGSTPGSNTDPKAQVDVHAELLKLDDLRQKGVLSSSEFESEKAKLLASRV